MLGVAAAIGAALSGLLYSESVVVLVVFTDHSGAVLVLFAVLLRRGTRHTADAMAQDIND